VTYGGCSSRIVVDEAFCLKVSDPLPLPPPRRCCAPASPRWDPGAGRRAAEPDPSPTVSKLIRKRRSIAGSLIGEIRETQGMLDFCAAHAIASDIEVIPIQHR
jgi:uncharacterized zinc-type alcohol dehydrogenase-like protein